MEKYKTIHEDIINASNHEVVKKTCISGSAVGCIAAGVVLGVAANALGDPNSSLPTFLFTAAGFILLFGIVKIFIHRSCHVYRPSNSRLKNSVTYFDVHESAALLSCVEKRNFVELARLKRIKDLGVKLEIAYAEDNSFAAVQVSEYIPYSYEAVTPVICCHGEEAAQLAAYCRNVEKA